MTFFLIAHKVRGEAAFDVAIQMPCPLCDLGDGMVKEAYCTECKDEGYWWILSSCGHRAHPYWHSPLPLIEMLFFACNYEIPEMPPDALDLFAANRPAMKPRIVRTTPPKVSATDLMDQL